MAFILAGIVMVGTLAICILMAFGSMMSTVQTISPKTLQHTFIVGMLLAAAIAASHWLPFIGW